LPQLVSLARSDRGPTRFEIVRAIGATLRGRADAGARKLLRELADDGSVKVSLAAIAGLAAARSSDDTAFLRTMVDQAAADRRRAAALALGEMHDAGSLDVLLTALSSKDDRLVGDAAWAIGEILAGGHPAGDARDGHDGLAGTPLGDTARTGAIVDRWLHLVQHGGWAAAIDGAAGLARVLWALPGPARAELLTRPRRDVLFARAFHKSRLVRVNLAHALAAIGDDDAVKLLAQLVKDDPSPHVRTAAARALHRSGSTSARARAAAARKLAGDSDPDPNVRAAAKTAPSAILARSEWRTFYVVDPSADDARVRQEPYFVHSADEVVWASYTDARGELTTEHIPAETLRDSVAPANRETEY
jgi:HEAT repeat protein